MNICLRAQCVQQAIRTLEMACGRPSDSVRLIAVSKGQSSDAILQAFHAGIRNFGENYLQEALSKQAVLLTHPITWHFIGPIQSNKIKAIAANFDWIHTICRQKIAQSLNDALVVLGRSVNVCIQVNIEGELSKSGIAPEEVADFLTYLHTLPQLHVRGLMVIPRLSQDEQIQYDVFSVLTQLLQKLNRQFNCTMDTLSMGMSDDYGAAIRAGSTMVRVGRAIFGER